MLELLKSRWPVFIAWLPGSLEPSHTVHLRYKMGQDFLDIQYIQKRQRGSFYFFLNTFRHCMIFFLLFLAMKRVHGKNLIFHFWPSKGMMGSRLIKKTRYVHLNFSGILCLHMYNFITLRGQPMFLFLIKWFQEIEITVLSNNACA